MNKIQLVLVSIVIVLSGCATSARIDKPKTAVQAEGMFPLTRNIQVYDVAGGSRKNYLQLSVIDRGDFKQALRDALAESEFLAVDSSGKYSLRAKIVEVIQPPSGVDISVTSVVQYTLVRESDGRDFLDERISASHSTDLDRTHTVGERVQSAQTGSAKRNIEKLIFKLNEVNQKLIASPMPE